MAKVFGQSSDLSGKVGNITYMQTKYGTVAFPSKKKAKVPRRSERQMEIRTQWVNLGAVYRQFRETLKKAFEDVGTMSAYNAFVQANINVVRVYISKQEKLNGGSVLAPYIITRGSLDSIDWAANSNNVLVTNLNLGGIEIGDATTLGEVSRAIIGNNFDYQNGDQIAFFAGQQTIDVVTATPRARITGYKIVLDVNSTQPLWSVVNKLGFSSVDGYLAMSTPVTNGAAAWVHSRDKNNELLVSTQYLYVDSNILQSYMDGSAFDTSVASYGGINTSEVFLDPGTGNSGANGSNDGWDNNATGGGDTPNGGGSGNGSTNSGNNGGNSGNSGSSSVTPTLSAPSFAGETQFTESTTVTMSAESGAEIHYTTDGSTPTAESATYSSPITLSETTTVKAIAVKNGVNSEVTSRTYTKSSGEGGMDQN